MSETYLEIKDLIQRNRKVMLIGLHGVGKTEMCVQIAKELKLKLLYFSSSTLDPFVDIIGIPVPKEDRDGNTYIEYVRRKDLMEAEWIFFDEINRGHPKTQNALLELIQFGSIMGTKLPNLKVVSAAINPPNIEMNYNVTELDPALMDRFEHFIEVKANPISEVYEVKGIEKENARRCISWYNGLQQNTKNYVTPRRLEYILKAHEMGLDIMRCVLPSEMIATVGEIPMKSLKEALAFQGTTSTVKEKLKDFSPEWIKENYDMCIRMSYSSDAQSLAESFKKMNANELNDSLSILQKMKKEFQYSIYSHFSAKIEKKSEKVKEKLPELFNWAVQTRKMMNEESVPVKNP